MSRLIVLGGPTAVGKTSLAIELAKHYNTEILSCDSRQIYKELNIGVARPTPDELAEVKHHFIATHSIHDTYNAGMYARDVDEKLRKLFATHEVVIMTGGTGLYIKAAVEGLDELPAENTQLREQLNLILKNEGLEAIQSIASNLGVNKEKVDFSNPQRIMRAIEIAQGGESETTESKPKERFYDVEYFYMDRPRDELYDRINQRVDIMLAEGFEKEAKSVYPYKDLNALQTVGYREFFKYFDGEWTREYAIDKMKQKTRNYAKRQLTWFRNQGEYIQCRPSLEELLIRLR